VVVVTAVAAAPSIVRGGKLSESIRELVVGSTYDANVLGMALVLIRRVL
jgi:hypothetical protein